MKKFYIIAALLFLTGSSSFGAAHEGINLKNYKDFEGRSAYAILGVHFKNAQDLFDRYERVSADLNPKRYAGTESEHAAKEAYDMLRTAYFKIVHPGPSRDYQIKLADMEGHIWNEGRRHSPPYDPKPYHSFNPRFDESNWMQVKQMSIDELSQVAQGCGNCAYNIQLLARAVLDIHDAVLALQHQFPASKDIPNIVHQSPELETAP